MVVRAVATWVLREAAAGREPAPMVKEPSQPLDPSFPVVVEAYLKITLEVARSFAASSAGPSS